MMIEILLKELLSEEMAFGVSETTRCFNEIVIAVISLLQGFELFWWHLQLVSRYLTSLLCID
jgi:hypothetical protein